MNRTRFSKGFREIGQRDCRERELVQKPVEQLPNDETTATSAAEDAYLETVSHIKKDFRQLIPEVQASRIDERTEKGIPEILPAEAYHMVFPNADPSELGRYEPDGRIVVKDASSETIKHVSIHEATHMTAFQERTFDDSNALTYRSGIHEIKLKSGDIIEDSNRGLNEGITELYSMREMQLRGEMPAWYSVTAYPEALRQAYNLQGIVGCNLIREAYFGGDLEKLKAELIRLNDGDESAWDSYSRCVDILEYETDPQMISEARKNLSEQNGRMIAFQELERHKNAKERQQ